MVNMFEKMKGEHFSLGLDIGEHSIKAAAVRFRSGLKNSLIGVYETKTNGFNQASITDLSEFTESIALTLKGLTKSAGIKFKDVHCGVGGKLIEKRLSNAVIPLTDRGNKVISTRDIRAIHKQARLLGMRMEDVIIHDYPQFYRVDDVNLATNPLGLYGRKLELQTMLFIAKNILLKNLSMAINNAGFNVSHFLVSSCYAADICLSEIQKKKGCLFINIGHTSSEILYYHDDFIKAFFYLPFGGDLFSKSIAQHVHVTSDLAEEIKRSYASILFDKEKEQEEILIKREDGYCPIKKAIITDAIEPVTQDFIQKCNEVIAEISPSLEANTEVVLAGGGSLLSGLPERLEQKLEVKVNLGQVDFATKGLHHAAKFIPAIGVSSEVKDFNSTNYKKHINRPKVESVVSKIKEFYNEYF